MTTLCLTDLLNLSFDNGELKNIKFQVLQRFLQVIIHELGLENIFVEFRGKESTFIQNEVNSANEEMRNKIFMMIKDKYDDNIHPKKAERARTKDKEDKEKKVLVIEKGIVMDHPGNRDASLQSSSLSLAHIEGRVRNLQSQIDHLGTQILPENDAILEKVRVSQETKPVTELLDTMKITKRMSGAEEEIDRLASLLEDVVKEYDDIKRIMSRIEEDFGQDINETLHQMKVVSAYINNIRPREVFYQTTLNKRLLKNEVGSEELKNNQTGKESTNDSDEQSTHTLPKVGSVEGKNKEFKKAGEESLGRVNIAVKKTNESDIVLSDFLKQEQKLRERNKQRKENSNMKTVSDGVSKEESEDEYYEILEPVSDNISSHVKTLNKLLQQHEQLKLDSEYLTVQVNTIADFAEVVLSEITSCKPNIEVLKEKIREVHLSPSDYKKTKSIKKDLIKIHMEICYRIDNIEGSISKYAAKIELNEEMHAENMNDVFVRIENLEKVLEETIKNVNLLKINENKQMDEMITRLGDKMASLDKELGLTSVLTNSLSADLRGHDIILKKLTDDLLALKAVKLDRFEFDELLSDKADIKQLNSRVSNDQFTQAYRFLSKSIEKTSEQISTQALFWQKWIDNFEETLDLKLSLKDFQLLAQSLVDEVKKTQAKAITAAFAEFGPLARGAKSKFMKNIQCISCDRNVTMKMENDFPILPILPKMPSHKTKTMKKGLTKGQEVPSDKSKATQNNAGKTKDSNMDTATSDNEE